ncbi:hypothetical protein ACFSC6_12205 [Rufibacter sediminis]|uniref:Uncharacterized protein n=1 Tax=Rufibacter sediminis TaxID=2762756 RepID=A0ABR6VUQ1_9BACT|nr:hypothetical protein [Rufibacter sediminis]MBC3540645.1 hypothetical protein [Rufibacter sediminis]
MAKGKKTGGRKAGTVNKTTASVKQALSEAFEKLGGITSLVQWGKEEPGEFYKLWVKTLPTEVKAEVSGPNGQAIQTQTVPATVEEAQRAYQELLNRTK